MVRYKELYRFVKPYRGLIAVCIVFHMCSTGLGLIMPWVMKIIIDKALGGSDLSLLYFLLGSVVLLYWVRAFFWYTSNFFTHYPVLRMLFDLRVKLFKHLQSLSLRFYQEYRTGKLISNILTDVSVLQGMVSTVVVGMSSSVFALVFVTVALILLSPTLSMVCVFVLPVVYFIFSRFKRVLNRRSMELREHMSEVSANLAEVINGIKVVKSFGKERTENRNFIEMLKPSFDMSLGLSMTNVTLAIIMDQLAIYTLVTVLGIGGYMVSTGNLTIGELVAFYAYMQMFFNLVAQMTNFAPAISDGSVSAERLLKLMAAVPEIKEKENPIRMPHSQGHVLFENVGFQYSVNRPVLNSFSLDVTPGQKVALVGPSGSGKSTIASLLMRFFDVNSGRILLDGIDIRDLTLDSLRRNVGIVLQESFLFSGTIEDNIRYGKQDASFEEIVEAAKMANAYEFIRDLPHGFKSEVGENGVSLSGGQKQRLAIARAVLHNPAVLILDEATSALDTVSESVVQQALDKLMEGRTTIIIAHRLSTVRNADIIVVLKDGCMVQKGSHEKLLLDDGVYRELYAMQLKEQKEKDVDAPDFAPLEYDSSKARRPAGKERI